MENTLVKIESNQLEKVVTESGLAIQEGEEIKQSYLPFVSDLAEIQAQASKINFENPQPIDETIARELRLKTVKIRTGSSDLKDSRKRIHLLKGNLEQAAYNLIAASCKLTEETFNNVEKAREIAEKKRKEILKQERVEKLLPYDVQTEFYDLANMPEETFTALMDGFKKAYEDRIAAEKKAEEDRIAREKADAEERERIRKENEQLKKEAEERERLAKIEADKRAKAEKERIAKEEAERKAREEKEAKERAEREAKEMAEYEAHEAALKAEREKREKLEAEQEAREEAERKAREVAKAKAEAEAKAKAELSKAPDKQKLTVMIDSLTLPESGVTTQPGHEVESVIFEKFNAFKNWAKSQINNM